ncbi:MAG: uridine kinase [Candidatus Excrementavichristensenella sp.]|nr:uridine kinase [Bacillota bacterium]NLL54532.1 uridine kinase [Clostridiales bacterium]
MLLIGICGASGSGKSTLARLLAEEIHKECVLLPQDAYYLNHSDMSFEERERINYDEPCAFDHDELLQDIMELMAGRSIIRKRYDFNLRLRSDSNEVIRPADVVILEGIHCFYDWRLRDMMDLRLYIEVDADICLLRRVKRDIRKRGREIENIYDQYLATVKPMFDRYIAGYVEYADLIVPGGGKNRRVIDIVAAYINSRRVKG